MGLSDYMQQHLYEMFTNESYENSQLAREKEMAQQAKQIKSEQSMHKSAIRGFANSMQRPYMGNVPINSGSYKGQTGTKRPLPNVPLIDDDDDFEMGD